ncbi:MAG: hypothetical protein LOX98_06545 [Lysobacter sp.]|nr:hypothetical protein [Lysobacter sp.]
MLGIAAIVRAGRGGPAAALVGIAFVAVAIVAGVTLVAAVAIAVAFAAVATALVGIAGVGVSVSISAVGIGVAAVAVVAVVAATGVAGIATVAPVVIIGAAPVAVVPTLADKAGSLGVIVVEVVVDPDRATPAVIAGHEAALELVELGRARLDAHALGKRAPAFTAAIAFPLVDDVTARTADHLGDRAGVVHVARFPVALEQQRGHQIPRRAVVADHLIDERLLVTAAVPVDVVQPSVHPHVAGARIPVDGLGRSGAQACRRGKRRGQAERAEQAGCRFHGVSPAGRECRSSASGVNGF